ncbi:MAG: hypothetical protein GF350_10405 [Chitinivibrionales bacterium]|nr:hypothetical protein [Chitinivibrionales bacterium]
MTEKSLDFHTGVYVGCGASHSWTWFADIFERCGYYGVSFLSENDIADNALDCCDCLFVSGGDTFSIAQGLGRKGADRIGRFVRNGGIYLGACAGAYLPLKSSLYPLNMFNFVQARITNLTKNLPDPKTDSDKFCTAYGCSYVFHPVREDIVIKLVTPDADTGSITAPLYGGPGIVPSQDVEVLAVYRDFTDRTEFLVDENLACDSIIGYAAAVRKRHGKGAFYLFGPHFEHPDYEDANRYLFSIMRTMHGKAGFTPACVHDKPVTCSTPVSRRVYLDFLKHISNARIVALALERTSYTWHIGRKVYDPEKIRVFIEAVWKRAQALYAGKGHECIPEEKILPLLKLAAAVNRDLRLLKRNAGTPQQGEFSANQLFDNLKEQTAAFLSLYFMIRRNSLTDDERRVTCTYTSKQPQCSIR